MTRGGDLRCLVAVPYTSECRACPTPAPWRNYSRWEDCAGADTRLSREHPSALREEKKVRKCPSAAGRTQILSAAIFFPPFVSGSDLGGRPCDHLSPKLELRPGSFSPQTLAEVS